MSLINTDLFIIGGGINGTGIAVDAAGRGLSVVLCEQGDLAGATSSASSKLIHGGLRYLENFEFKLVHEALAEREILMRKAPHLIHPLEFVLPHESHLRPTWMIRIGLFLYDHLARRSTLPSSRKLNLRKCVEGKALKSDFKTGFSYADCQTDDARMVILNAIAAREKGARILTHTRCESAHRENNFWHIHLRLKNGELLEVNAKAVVNAAGPWVMDVIQNVLKIPTHSQVALIQGSHIVVPKLYEGEHAYILQNKDNRIVFAIPYQNNFTLIGTTDITFTGNLNEVHASTAEIDYLCEIINFYFIKRISKNDIVWQYSGVRPLFNDQSHNVSKITREYHLEIQDQQKKLPAISVFGGKITTYRTLSEHVVEKLRLYFPDLKPAWTADAPLPGGDFGDKTVVQYRQELHEKYPWLSEEILQRYIQLYGTRCEMILNNAQQISDLRTHFGAGLYAREIQYLIQHEWARSAEDILWRRTKLGLLLQDNEINNLEKYLIDLSFY